MHQGKFRIIVASIMLLLMVACSGNGFRSGSTRLRIDCPELAGKHVVLEEIKVEGIVRIDSGFVGEKGLEFRIAQEEKSFFILRSGPQDMLVLLLHPGDRISVDQCGNSTLEGSSVTGSHESRVIQEYYRVTEKHQTRADSLGRVFNASKSLPGFEEIRASVDSSYHSIVGMQREFTRALIQQNLSSLVSIFLVNQRFGPIRLFPVREEYELFRLIDSALMVTDLDNSHVADHHERVMEETQRREEEAYALERLQPGRPVPAVKLTGLDGQSISIDSLRGKYVLIYFWAAWDASSRKFNRTITSVYEKFRSSRFEILAISMDDNRKIWEAAVQLDHLEMLNASDLLAIDSPLQKLFNLGKDLPVMYLIDDQGLIIRKLNDTDDLEGILDELLSS